jgi:galactoside O-acetyltransferase
MATMLGVPAPTTAFPGIDVLGEECRIADSVTILRFDDGTPRRAIELGHRVSLYDGVRLVVGDPRQHPDTGIIMGNDVIINTFCYLSGEGGLEIGDTVLLGSHVRLLSAGHAIDQGDPRIWYNPLTYGKIRIGTGAWIGSGATVLEGVSIGEGAVVGAGSVVTRPVPAFGIAVGNPARLLRYRKGFEPPRRPWYRWRR